MEYSGAGGKLIHEKNQKQKISWHCPFKCCWMRLSSLSLISTFSAFTDFWWTQQRTSSSQLLVHPLLHILCRWFPRLSPFFSSTCSSFTSAGIASGLRRLFTVASLGGGRCKGALWVCSCRLEYMRQTPVFLFCWSLKIWSTPPRHFLLSSHQTSFITLRRQGRPSPPWETCGGEEGVWSAGEGRHCPPFRQPLVFTSAHDGEGGAGGRAAIFGGWIWLQSQTLSRFQTCRISPMSPPAAPSSLR